MKKWIGVIGFLLGIAFSSVSFAVELTLSLESFPPATLPTVSKIIDIPDPDDQVEIARQAAMLALAPEGWDFAGQGVKSLDVHS